jgi:hypothetical protein
MDFLDVEDPVDPSFDPEWEARQGLRQSETQSRAFGLGEYGWGVDHGGVFLEEDDEDDWDDWEDY